MNIKQIATRNGVEKHSAIKLISVPTFADQRTYLHHQCVT